VVVLYCRGLRLVSAGLLLLISAIAYADITIVSGETVTLSDSEIIGVDGDLTITGAHNGASSAQIRVTENWSKTSTFTHNGAAVYLTGSGTTSGGVDARIDKCKAESGYLASIGELINIFRSRATFPVKSGLTWPSDSDMNHVVSASPSINTDHNGISGNWGIRFHDSGSRYPAAGYSDTTDGFVCLGPIYYSN